MSGIGLILVRFYHPSIVQTQIRRPAQAQPHALFTDKHLVRQSLPGPTLIKDP